MWAQRIGAFALVLLAMPSRGRADTLDEAAAALTAARLLGDAYLGSEERRTRARAARLDETRVRTWLEQGLKPCLERTERCNEADLRAPRRRVLERLFDLLDEFGTTASVPLTFRLETRGFYRAGMAREKIFERAFRARMRSATCQPPTDAEIARADASARGFVVFEMTGGELRARHPTATERADLAYFLAASDGSGPPVGGSPESKAASFAHPAKDDAARDRVYDAFSTAKMRGDLRSMIRHGQSYLQLLGYPGADYGRNENAFAWGGARFSYVMRDVAEAYEATGRFREAALLYRAADPGGGACGTSTDTRWQEQVGGFIRTAESAGLCRMAVRERMLGIDEDTAPSLYGTARLAQSGFDVARLFRGALTALYRDLPNAKLSAALVRSAADVRAQAATRLTSHGPEAYERDVLAIEGYAAHSDVSTLPVLERIASTGPAEVRMRAVVALGKLARAPEGNPCLPLCEDGTLGSGSFGSDWERPIPARARTCATDFGDRERRRLARQILPWLDDTAHPELGEAVLEALGRLAVPESAPRLRKELGSRIATPGLCQLTTRGGVERCVPLYRRRELAKEALQRIRAVSANRRDERRRGCRVHTSLDDE